MFNEVAATEINPKWSVLVQRQEPLYDKSQDPRSEFARDYDRILHCKAYRRLKHKTQVFFAPENDHVCTRIEHVNHVTAISRTIAKYLKLNTELAMAIAIGHDLGHAPFGHHGGSILKDMAKKAGFEFCHETNSLWFADNLETLEDDKRKHRNLALTYAVRDGIVCHSGEAKNSSINPRIEHIDLSSITKAGEFQPFTWEGCVVKLADKIAYLGRDIEDAVSLGIITAMEFHHKYKHLRKYLPIPLPITEINNTILINHFVTDLCKSSSPGSGIRLSNDSAHLMKEIGTISKDLIYRHPRLKCYKNLPSLCWDPYLRCYPIAMMVSIP